MFRIDISGHGMQRMIKRLDLSVEPTYKNLAILKNRILVNGRFIRKKSRLHNLLLKESKISIEIKDTIQYIMDSPTGAIHVMSKKELVLTHITTLPPRTYHKSFIDDKTFVNFTKGQFIDDYI